MKTKAEQFEDDIFDILCEYVDEPAGRGAGYGLMDNGQVLLKELIDNFVKEGNVMDNDKEVYEVCIVPKADGSEIILDSFYCVTAKKAEMAAIAKYSDKVTEETVVAVRPFQRKS